MTTLISWLGVDSRQAGSIYLASDSRLTWGDSSSWDAGKKLFAARNMPEIFGYCGDVTFPTQVLAQFCEQIDSGTVFSNNDSFERKLEIAYACIDQSFTTYPKKNLGDEFQILYVSRVGIGMGAEFFAGAISWERSKNNLEAIILPMPKRSSLIKGIGTGSQSIEDWYYRWKTSDVQNTSRSVFGAFCDSLESGNDPMSGGAPQLIGLYRIGQPKVFGVIWHGQRYLSGSLVSNDVKLNDVEWRNSRFEICDPNTMSRQDGAQIQPRPKIVLPT
ncbi:MAG: hypothetical protein WAW41_03175 [Methylobacter sp.]